MRSQVVLAGKYTVGERIGRGGAGMVFHGKHVEMGRDVAIKMVDLTKALQQDPNAAARFAQEARIISQLHSPNTVTVFDYGREGGVMYLVMERIKGRSLAQELRREGGRMVEERVVRCGMDVLSSLEEAHQLGILHRDIKPGNVMVTADFRGEEQFKVLDFGIARMSGAGGEQELAGTPRYAAPEQLSGGKIGEVSDVYSVGAMMWMMLAGEPPVGGLKEWGEVSVFHERAPVPMLPKGVSRELREIVERACERDPGARWQSAGEMREALGGWSPGGQVLSSSCHVVDPNVGPIALFEEEDVVVPPVVRGQVRVPDLLAGVEELELEDVGVVADVKRAPRKALAERTKVGRGGGSGSGRGGKVALIGVVGMLGVVGMVWVRGGGEQVMASRQKVAVVREARVAAKREVVKGPVVSRAGVERALGATGWEAFRREEREMLGTFSRESIVYRKGGMEVEVMWIHARSLDVLRGLEENVGAGERFVRLDDARGVRLRAGRGGASGVEEMGRMLVKYRDLVLAKGSR